MKEIENLEALRKRSKELVIAIDAMKKNASDAVVDYLQLFTCKKIIASFEIACPWRNEDGAWELRGRVRFKAENSNRDTDFGSDFDITIQEKGGIKINKGTIGTYGLTDSYQLARDRLLADIWDNHDMIIGLVKEKININDYAELKDVNRQIRLIEDALERAKDLEEDNKALEQLKRSIMLGCHGSRIKYDTEKDYWSTERIGVEHFYYDLEVIDKITDKSVLTHEKDMSWCKHRHDLGQIIYKVRHKILECYETEPAGYVILDKDLPPQEGVGQ